MQTVQTTFDKTIGLPIPPINTIAPEHAGHVALFIFSTLFLFVFIYSIKNWYDTKRPVLLFLMLGGVLASVTEPFADLLGAVWHPIINQKAAFTLFGRAIPWWIVGACSFYFGALVAITYLILTRGVTRRQIWVLFTIVCVVDIILEDVWLLRLGTYSYYGNQPLWFDLFPYWWAPCNGLGAFIAATAATIIVPHLRRWQLLLLPLLATMSDCANYGLIAIPSFAVVNAKSLPWLITQAGGIATLVLAILIVHGLSLIIATDSPWEIRKLIKAVHPDTNLLKNQ